MKILVINAGSSSLKYQLFDMDSGEVTAKGLCERIGVDGRVTHKRPGKENYVLEKALPDHETALSTGLSLITDKELGVIKDISEIDAVGHRIAHGGEKLRSSSLIGEKELEYLHSIAEINPLHGSPAIKGIEACRKILPDIPQVGVFDTAFYGTLPEYAYIYPLPYEYYEKYKVGTSHRYVTAEAAKMIGKPLSELKVITCHLGNGSSVTATKYGNAVWTSMGFTPQDGIMMGTRTGAIDPTVLTYIMKKEGLSAEEAEDMINRKSGLYGVSGVSSDCREVMQAEKNGDARSHLAVEMLVDSVKKAIGSSLAEMNGADVLVFTAGIGENDAEIRSRICKDMDFFGIKIDEEANVTAKRGTEQDITSADGKVRVLIIPTDEEYMIAKDTQNLANKQ